MAKFIIYQKPTCNTCRIVLRELKEKGADFESVNYYEKPFKKSKLKNLLVKMNLRPRDILRTKEPIYKKLKLAEKNYSDNEILDLMIKYPDLIQRPIIVKGKKVILARPPEKIKDLL